ncbi:MAG: sensor histidine kinase [Clostridiaceae bacterium]|nr:sensor histidine kinase [Clostridiaceae bacterium]
MNILSYAKERFGFVLSSLFLLLFIVFLLSGLKVETYAIVLISILICIVNFTFFISEYIKKKRTLDNIYAKVEALDKKYLLSEIVDIPEDIYDKKLYEILKLCNKSMNDYVSKVERENKEFREFIELWVHEVKTPLASSKLIIENNKDSVTSSIKEEIDRVDDCIEKALYYARSNTLEKDFIIKNVSLESIINFSLRKNAHALIEKKVSIVKENVDFQVFADEKWIEFVIHQVISNSIKYFNKQANSLLFKGFEEGENIILSIKDNGRGMDENTALKAFDKGFTGETGRIFKASTGIGLYLCKKLCLKMGLDIKIRSVADEYCEVLILFPKTKMMTFE